MKLLHTTPARNITSILTDGLLLAFACERSRVIWLTHPRLRTWARHHVRRRHQLGPAGPLAALEVTIPANWLSPRGQGIYSCNMDIAPHTLRLLPADPADGIIVV
jgi:hypothetical protein